MPMRRRQTEKPDSAQIVPPALAIAVICFGRAEAVHLRIARCLSGGDTYARLYGLLARSEKIRTPAPPDSKIGEGR